MRKRIERSLLAFVFLLVSLFLLNANGESGEKAAKSRHLTAPMHEMLGMLNEYLSRFNYYTNEPHPSLIETFYPKETKVVERFEKLLADHAKITGMRRDWKKEIGKQGHVRFMSEAWADVINSFYVRIETRYSVRAVYEKQWATLDPEIFAGASRRNMLRFLQGAYSRFGLPDKSSSIMMANAPYKMQVIADVLKKLGCSDVTIFVLPSIPHLYQVHFAPCPVVREGLGIQRTVLFPEENFPNGDWRLFKKSD